MIKRWGDGNTAAVLVSREDRLAWERVILKYSVMSHFFSFSSETSEKFPDNQTWNSKPL